MTQQTEEKRRGSSKTNRPSILSYYPYPTFRLGHKEALLYIEDNIDSSDIFLIVAPTGCGKTAIRQTIASWYKDCLMLVPTNQLIHQERLEYPTTRAIFGKDSEYYSLPEYSYEVDKVRCLSGAQAGEPVLATPYAALAHRLNRSMLVFDEGHKMLELNTDLSAKKIFRHKANYPHNIYDRAQLEKWLREDAYTLSDKARKQLLEKLETNDYLIKREAALYHGDARDCIKFIPLTPGIHGAFKKNLKKLIILSATINEIDVTELKIGRGNRILKVELPSIIPPERRPIVKQYVGAMNYYNLSKLTDAVGSKLIELLEFHGTRGLAHVTYSQAALLKQSRFGSDPRFIFHDKFTGKEKLRLWMSEGGRGKVFIASGFSEGLDLKGDEFQWQAICKIGWPSLSDTAIKKKTETSQDWYIWQTLKDFLQRVGRISRSEIDFGVTYVLDSTADRLISTAKESGLLPKYVPEWE